MKKGMDTVQIENKRVMVRLDFNVPLKGTTISDDTRIRMSLPTIEEVVQKGANGVILLSHLGRVQSEDDKKKLSLRPVYLRLKELLPQYNVMFCDEMNQEKFDKIINSLKKNDVLLLENTRFMDFEDGKKINAESSCDESLSKYWAKYCDLFINDAFGTAHRKHASNYGIAKFAKESVVGRLVEKELIGISKAIKDPKRPLVAILGGAKVSDKIGILSTFLENADKVIVAGGMAYTFMVAQGKTIGTSLFESDRLELAKELLEKHGDKIVLPVDNTGSSDFSNSSEKHYFEGNIPSGMMGLDIGEKSTELFKSIISKAKTILWNGPMGVFEFDKYANGTMEIAKYIGSLKEIYSVIGGGDSVAAVNKLDHSKYHFGHISTGGGASLALLEGKELVGFSPIQEV